LRLEAKEKGRPMLTEVTAEEVNCGEVVPVKV
jgi:hypothetical protein